MTVCLSVCVLLPTVVFLSPARHQAYAAAAAHAAAGGVFERGALVSRCLCCARQAALCDLRVLCAAASSLCAVGRQVELLRADE